VRAYVSIAVINQRTYSTAVINQCTYSIAVINQCTYSIAVINQCTYSIVTTALRTLSVGSLIHLAIAVEGAVSSVDEPAITGFVTCV
jgi:hypothetical protein